MASDDISTLLRAAAEPTWAAVQLMTGVKEAMVPMPQGQMPPPPMDPAMMGGMPPGGMPPDPSMMGGMPPPGMPPMDPAMGGMPMDPAMMGGMPPPDPAAAMGGLGGAGPLPPEQLASMPGGAPGVEGDPGSGGSLEEKLMQVINQKFDELSQKMGVQPTGGTGPTGSGSGGGKAKTDEAIARLQSTLDKMVAYFGGKDGKPIDQVVAEPSGGGADMSALANMVQGGQSAQGGAKAAMVREFKSRSDDVMAAFTDLMGG